MQLLPWRWTLPISGSRHSFSKCTTTGSKYLHWQSPKNNKEAFCAAPCWKQRDLWLPDGCWPVFRPAWPYQYASAVAGLYPASHPVVIGIGSSPTVTLNQISGIGWMDNRLLHILFNIKHTVCQYRPKHADRYVQERILGFLPVSLNATRTSFN